MQCIILPEKWVYSETAKTCNLGHAMNGEPQASLENKGEECSFTEEKAELVGGAVINRVRWEFQASLRWLSCEGPSLAGLLSGEETFFLPPAG